MCATAVLNSLPSVVLNALWKDRQAQTAAIFVVSTCRSFASSWRRSEGALGLTKSRKASEEQTTRGQWRKGPQGRRGARVAVLFLSSALAGVLISRPSLAGERQYVSQCWSELSLPPGLKGQTQIPGPTMVRQQEGALRFAQRFALGVLGKLRCGARVPPKRRYQSPPSGGRAGTAIERPSHCCHCVPLFRPQSGATPATMAEVVNGGKPPENVASWTFACHKLGLLLRNFCMGWGDFLWRPTTGGP